MKNKEDATFIDTVSVIIPTHYRSDRLKIAIDSVLAQTWNNLEIIVVSDGYDVATSSLMKRYSNLDSRIVFFSYDESRGGNHARNVGIKNATGDYIAFLDDDDTWYPTKIERQMKVLQQSKEIGLVSCGIQVVYDNLNIKYKSFFTKEGDLSKTILYANYIGSTSRVLLRKEALEKCGVFDEAIPARQDHDLWIRVCQKYKVGYLNSIEMDYHVYDTLGEGQQVSKSMSKFLQAHDVLMEKYQHLYKALTNDEFKLLMSCKYISLAQRAYEIGDRKKCKNFAWKSIYEKFNKEALFFCFLWWIPREFLVRIKALIDHIV